ncbi:MAG: bile acid:sodium symporter family protein [Candidatus Pacebacteria bacterium]|nr:bile acid:sodium symporter family protein [Candidatus Paceibacterota bacterium]
MEQFLDTNIFVSIFLPIIIGLVMYVMGLSLTITDFKRLLDSPKAVTIGILAQIIGAPLIAFGLAHIFNLDPILSVSLMLLAAVPGGPMSNFLSFLADGDVALAVSLTAINSVVTIFTIPLIVNLAANYFTGTTYTLHLPFVDTILQIALITLLPIVLGVLTYRYFSNVAYKVLRVAKIVTPIILIAVVFTAMILEREFFVAFAKQAALIAAALAVCMFAFGYFIGAPFRLGKKQKTTLGIEVGMQNASLAISIAVSPYLLNAPQVAIVPSAYGFVMSTIVVGYIYLVTRESSVQDKKRNIIFLIGFTIAIITMLVLIFAL